MYRDLYVEALSRIGELELDGSSLQNVIQSLQDMKITMVSHKQPHSSCCLNWDIMLKHVSLAFFFFVCVCVLRQSIFSLLRVKCVYLSQQTSVRSDTDAALSNMNEIGDIVREDHQSLISHVRTACCLILSHTS